MPRSPLRGQGAGRSVAGVKRYFVGARQRYRVRVQPITKDKTMATNDRSFDRRDLLRSFGLGLLGTSCARWLPSLAAEIAQDPRRRRHCILLWMSGGPSQTDT